MERMMSFLIEHYAGNFPLWLAPVQLKIVTVTDQQLEYARKVYQELKASGWRVELDERNEKLGYKIREAQLAKIPYAVVIGDKEVAAQTVAPRRRGGENLPPMSVHDFIQRLRSELAQGGGEA
jgi:threonyl-tRNA synthetase